MRKSSPFVPGAWGSRGRPSQPVTTSNNSRNAETSITGASLYHRPEITPEPSIQSWNITGSPFTG